MSEKRMSDELAAIEAALGSLAPVPSGILRDRLMFFAGRASAPTRKRSVAAWLWPCAVAASLLMAATFGVLWAADGNRPIVERAVFVPAKSVRGGFDIPVGASLPPSPWENRRLCRLVLEKGVDAMPKLDYLSLPNTRAAPHDESNRDLLNQLLKDSTI